MSESTEGAEHGPPEPLIRVVRGTPTPEELAALVGVLVRHPRPATAPRSAAAPLWAAASLWAASARPGFDRRLTSWRAGALPGVRAG
jgi:Acyl-CoA carboxylase epsilon subunit